MRPPSDMPSPAARRLRSSGSNRGRTLLIVAAIADQVHAAGGVLDCHLMIETPERQIDDFAAAGADSITFHAEATPHAHRLLGAVLTYADESFNTILELGFATSIRKEWDWRRSRGESTRNLEAFRGWLERD